MKSAIVIVVVVLALNGSLAKPKPGFIYSFPAASSHTTVLRDALGNQATAYAYQDGHSSSVAVSRNDVSKHLAYVPAPVAPVIYEEAVQPDYHHHIPGAYYGSYEPYYV